MYQITIVTGLHDVEELYATTYEVARAFCEAYAEDHDLAVVDPDMRNEWQGEQELYMFELDAMDSVDAAQQVAEVMSS